MRTPAKVVLINGAFGVGKTTVARALCEALSKGSIYDPEPAGILLWRLADWIPLRGSETDDFQDMPAWRRCTVLGTRIACALKPGPIVVPMTFDNPEYFGDVWDGICAFERTATAFCLTATQATIRERLASRGTDPDGPWIARRVQECIRAHLDDRFGLRIDTETRGVDAIVREILGRLERHP